MFLFIQTLAPALSLFCRGDITCSCLQLAQVFPSVLFKFYSPALKALFSTRPRIKVPPSTIEPGCSSKPALGRRIFLFI